MSLQTLIQSSYEPGIYDRYIDSPIRRTQTHFRLQAHSGIFHMLPLGRRVQEKLEALIDKYMSNLSEENLRFASS